MKKFAVIIRQLGSSKLNVFDDLSAATSVEFSLWMGTDVNRLLLYDATTFVTSSTGQGICESMFLFLVHQSRIMLRSRLWSGTSCNTAMSSSLRKFFATCNLQQGNPSYWNISPSPISGNRRDFYKERYISLLSVPSGANNFTRKNLHEPYRNRAATLVVSSLCSKVRIDR